MASDFNLILEPEIKTSDSRNVGRLSTYLTCLVSKPKKEVLSELSKVSIESKNKGE